MEKEQIGLAWEMSWNKYLEKVRLFKSDLKVKTGAEHQLCIQNYCRNYIESNMNTHRVIFLSQALNGKLEAEELKNLFETSMELSIDGALKTMDGNPGIADAKLKSETHEYEIVFTEMGFYPEITKELIEKGGILYGNVCIETDVEFTGNVLNSGTITIAKDASLTMKEGTTIVSKLIENYGTFRGTISGNISVHDGGVFNGSLFTGCISAEGAVTITGLYVADKLTITDNSVITLDNSCGMFNAMEIGKNVTLIFAESEPGLSGFEGMRWYMDFDHPLSDPMRQKWFLLGDKTPTDMLGRTWSVPFDKGAILRPDLNEGGVIKMESDLKIVGAEGTHHNYGILAFGKEKITDVEGVVYVYTTFGLAYPQVDGKNLVISNVTGDGTTTSPYAMTYKEKNPNHKYISPMDLSLQALATPIISEKFPNVVWRFDTLKEGFVWYGYKVFSDCEHWHGENGKEILKIMVKKEE